MKQVIPVFLTPLVLGLSSLFAAPESTPLSSLPFEQAVAGAEQAKKEILVYFGTAWHGQCKRMESLTFSHPKVREVLERKVLFVRVDPEKEPALAKRFSVVDYPTLVLLSPDGKQRQRLVGFTEVRKLVLALDEEAGADFAKTRPAKTGPLLDARAMSQESARYNHAIADGDHASAIRVLLDLLDRRDPDDPDYRRNQFRGLLSQYRTLIKSDPSLREELLWRRDAARSAMLKSSKKKADCMVYAAISSVLSDDQDLVDAFLSLPVGDPRRDIIGLDLFKPLLKRRLYTEALEVRPEIGFWQTFETTVEKATSQGATPGMQWIAVTHGLERLEIYCGLGKQEEAQRLVGLMERLALSEQARARIDDLLRQGESVAARR